VQSLQLDGTDIALPAHPSDRAVSQQTARQVTDMLQGVVSDPGGTGWRAAALGRPAAGKTGTTDENRSAWFAGYTPDLVSVVAMFGEQHDTGKQVTLTGTAGGGQVFGGSFPAQIWTDYMKSALKGRPVQDFTAPNAVRSTGPAAGTPSTTAPSSPAAPSPNPGTPTATPTPNTGTSTAAPTAPVVPGTPATPPPVPQPSTPPVVPSPSPSTTAPTPPASTGPSTGGSANDHAVVPTG
jgi:membrane peptidoglycan carboxypeptidase